MHLSLLDVLRCPYCGGRLALVDSLFHNREGDELHDGILGCHCCIFPVVAGIPVMHLDSAAKKASAHVEAGQPDLARRAMFNLDDADHAARFDEVALSNQATYREAVQTLEPGPEGGYFLYRFSDPSYVVAHPLVRAVAGAVLRTGGRAIDICGGSGHLTRSLMDLSAEPPVLADLDFAKIWLARRFVAPGCEAVCCDGNSPLPFGRGGFRYAMCADAVMYLWTRRLFVLEMLRLIDGSDAPGAAVITHAHNARQWSPAHGNPLPPEGYRDLFETLEPRVFAEGTLFADVVREGLLDLSRHHAADSLDADPAIDIIASRHEGIFTRHEVELAPGAPGELRVNPLYVREPEGDRVRLRLRFPSEDYECEFGACRKYQPDEVVVEEAALAALADGRVPSELEELVRRRVILDLPTRYY